MAKFRVMFDEKKSGAVVFEAEDKNHALEIYEGLVDGTITEEEIDDLYEEIQDFDINYYELTTLDGKNLSN